MRVRIVRPLPDFCCRQSVTFSSSQLLNSTTIAPGTTQPTSNVLLRSSRRDVSSLLVTGDSRLLLASMEFTQETSMY